MESIESIVREKLLAYIHPTRPSGAAQEAAFARAVEIQAAHEEKQAAITAEMPDGAASVSFGDFSVSFQAGGARAAMYTDATLDPGAWAVLYNAGLIRRGAIPRARRI